MSRGCYMVTRDVTRDECPWLPESIPMGSLVYLYVGHTYMVIGDSLPFTRRPQQPPFFELPRDAVEMYDTDDDREDRL